MIFTCQWNGPRMGRSLSYKRGGPDLNTWLVYQVVERVQPCILWICVTGIYRYWIFPVYFPLLLFLCYFWVLFYYAPVNTSPWTVHFWHCK